MNVGVTTLNLSREKGATVERGSARCAETGKIVPTRKGGALTVRNGEGHIWYPSESFGLDRRDEAAQEADRIARRDFAYVALGPIISEGENGSFAIGERVGVMIYLRPREDGNRTS